MSFLIDTNIVTELGKGARCDPGVAGWLGEAGEEDLWLSVLVLGELRKGARIWCKNSVSSGLILR